MKRKLPKKLTKFNQLEVLNKIKELMERKVVEGESGSNSRRSEGIYNLHNGRNRFWIIW
jgi:hypothetical protein